MPSAATITTPHANLLGEFHPEHSDEALEGHPFLTQAQARLEHCIVLFREEVMYFHS